MLNQPFDTHAAGNRLQTERERLGLTLESCSDQAKIPSSVLSAYEAGAASITLEHIYRLGVLKFDVVYIIFELRPSELMQFDLDLVWKECIGTADRLAQRSDYKMPEWLRIMTVLYLYEWIVGRSHEIKDSFDASHHGPKPKVLHEAFARLMRLEEDKLQA